MKKILALALAAVSLFSVVSLTSCASSSGDTLESGVLKIGVDDTYPPMEYKDTTGSKDIGFDVDVANEIGKRLGKKVEFVSTSWDGIFAALNAKKFDCILSAVSMTADREKKFAFTKPYIANAQMIVVKPGNTSITKETDLAGKTVGVQVSTTANDSATKLAGKGIKFTLKTYDQIIQPFQDMKAGRLDAIIVDEVVGQYYVATDPSAYKAAAVKLTNEPIGVCFRKSDTALRDKVQKQIDAMNSDGSMKKISVKWFNADLTSNIDSKLWGTD